MQRFDEEGAAAAPMKPVKYTAGPGGLSSPAALATPLATLTKHCFGGRSICLGRLSLG